MNLPLLRQSIFYGDNDRYILKKDILSQLIQKRWVIENQVPLEKDPKGVNLNGHLSYLKKHS